MKQIVLPLTLATVLPLTAIAQEPDSDGGDTGSSLMERGMELFLDGLTQEMTPALDDLEGMVQLFSESIGPSMAEFMAEMGPALAKIAAEVEDWSRYELPEILPNGDIIIRRKPDPEGRDQAPGDRDDRGREPADDGQDPSVTDL